MRGDRAPRPAGKACSNGSVAATVQLPDTAGKLARASALRRECVDIRSVQVSEVEEYREGNHNICCWCIVSISMGWGEGDEIDVMGPLCVTNKSLYLKL